MIDLFSYVTQNFSPFVKGKDWIFGFYTNKGCLQVGNHVFSSHRLKNSQIRSKN